ncbi:hypothetical protein F4680DRAFT_66634 [Xylaria scruposa]|nr:hypothetical protein F4680DRAFT_66634 [Xylaria scruposa]
MLIASDFLQLKKLEGFALPAQIPMLHAGQPPGPPRIRANKEVMMMSIQRLISAAWKHRYLWAAPLNLALNLPFWQCVGIESGIEETAARRLFLGLLDARRDYHRQRGRNPSLTPRDHLGYWADLLCDYQVNLFRKHGLVYLYATTISHATNVKQKPDSKLKIPVAKRRRFSESYSSGFRPSESRSERSSPESEEDNPQPSADLMKRIKETSDMRKKRVDMEKWLLTVPNDTKEHMHAIIALEDLKKDLDVKLEQVRDAHREFLNRVGHTRSSDDSSRSPSIKIEETDDEEVSAGDKRTKSQEARDKVVLPSIEEEIIQPVPMPYHLKIHP